VLKGLFRIIRPINSFMIGFAAIIGSIISLRAIPSFRIIILDFLVGFFICAMSMVFNDYADREIDKINAPNRPIPSGEISERIAIVYGLFLMFLGLFFSLLINIQCFIFALVTACIALLYDFYLKRTGFIGNLTVSYSSIVPFIFGGLAISGNIDILLSLFILMAFFSLIGREVTKGMVDIRGDRIKNIRTLALTIGLRRSAIVASFFYLLAVALSPIPIILGIVNIYYKVLIIFVDIGFILLSISLTKNPSPENARNVKNKVIYVMLLALIMYILSII